MKTTLSPPPKPQGDDYDSPWKEAIEHYFPDFMAFFFPVAYDQIDWAKGYEFLEQELRKIMREAGIGKRFVDKLVKVTLKNGEENWVYVHIEVQSSYDHRLGQRIFVYNYRIFDRFTQPVASFVVLADDTPSWRPHQYRYEVLGSKTSIEFPIAKLTDYLERQDELLASDNAFALFTVAHLRTRATVGSDPKRYQVKKTLIAILTAKGWTPERINHLLKALDDLMYLPPELNEKLWYELTEHQPETVMNYLASLEHNAMERGLLKGELRGESKLLRKQLEKRFGSLPLIVTERLNQANEQELESWGEAVLTASTLDAVFQTTTTH